MDLKIGNNSQIQRPRLSGLYASASPATIWAKFRPLLAALGQFRQNHYKINIHSSNIVKSLRCCRIHLKLVSRHSISLLNMNQCMIIKIQRV